MSKHNALTLDETAQWLRVTRRTVERMIADGELPSVKVRRRRLIPISAVRALIADDDQGGLRSA